MSDITYGHWRDLAPSDSPEVMLNDLFDLIVENNSGLEPEHRDQYVESCREDGDFRRRLLAKVIRNTLHNIEISTRSGGVLIPDPRAPIRLDNDLYFRGPAPEDGSDDSDTVKPVIEEELSTLWQGMPELYQAALDEPGWLYAP